METKLIRVFWDEVERGFYASVGFKQSSQSMLTPGEMFDVTGDIEAECEKHSLTFNGRRFEGIAGK